MRAELENIFIDIDDFRNSNWMAVIENLDREDYSSIWQALSDAARRAMEEGSHKQSKVLWLLADASSMILKPSSINAPFKPFAPYFEGRRTAIPEDFSESDVIYFSQIVNEVNNIWLKARLADLVWFINRKFGVSFALIAIDAYRSIPLERETWMRGGRECWERAISLAWTLKAGGNERIIQMELEIISTFQSATAEDKSFVLQLANLLLLNRLGNSKGIDIAEKLASLAQDYEIKGDLWEARSFFEASGKWFKVLDNNAKAAEMTVNVAESWVKEAIARISSENPIHTLAASYYEKAIQTYRTVPRNERVTHNVEERISELRKRMNESGEKSLNEMGTFSSPSINIADIVEISKNAVKGKNTIDALYAFANIDSGAKEENIRNSSEKSLHEFPLSGLFASSHMGRDGRVIAKQPGYGFGKTDSEEYEAALWEKMIRSYQLNLGLVVQASIWPALGVLVLEHRLREEDFIELANHSPIVPNGREKLFGKALYAGYENDFVTAIHLLVPQIEHMVRWHLKNAGKATTNIDKNGIENEYGLSTLMEISETSEIFGKDWSFELKALFCDPFGPNLRNELAHGLLDNANCQSAFSVYAWWFGLKLVFNTFWSARRIAAPENEEAV